MIKIFNLDDIGIEEILLREDSSLDEKIELAVDEIIDDIKRNGDLAVKKYTEKFDKAKIDSLVVSEDEIELAWNNVDPDFISILKEAAENIELFHSKQVKNDFICDSGKGRITGQKVTPINHVGIYVPGGTARYPSTVLMNAIPAKIAGVNNISIVTPPNEDGSIPDVILAAAKIAGVDNIYKVGGAQSVAALSYGTETIPKVDKIVGPGNIFVATAKRKVFGRVDIDMIAGPSEILVLADETANTSYIAADMLSQAEHDELASAILVCTSKQQALEVQSEIEIQLKNLKRESIARKSIENRGKIIVANNIDDAIDVVNVIAPEHLEICTDDPFIYLNQVKNAGSIFLGNNVPEALGDYFAGPNHTLPTSGTAKFSSPLSVDDFVKKSQFIYYSRKALEEVEEKVSRFAREEGLEAHAKSIEIRFNK
ncbi:histidinol dehydrogenase [Peptostreptococcus faecalis]|uniref:histidinol dehydrogenase n=1 Tax=Peptostreptococcus faecalis TaxID=2045015 RepID=UPI000C7A151F|nr:histidinol dehydrogenase [Peptostreptococcus faecalis]